MGRNAKSVRYLLIGVFATMGFSLLISGCAPREPAAETPPHILAELQESRQYYTQVGMWADRGVRVYGTNYREGGHIPPGTAVEVQSVRGDVIQFTIPERDGEGFELVNVQRHTMVDTPTLFERSFAREPVDLDDKPEEIRQAIERGEIILGMDRDEVITARGYPPMHETPTLESDRWRYWINRFATRIVRFQDGEVVEIIE